MVEFRYVFVHLLLFVFSVVPTWTEVSETKEPNLLGREQTKCGKSRQWEVKLQWLRSFRRPERFVPIQQTSKHSVYQHIKTVKSPRIEGGLGHPVRSGTQDGSSNPDKTSDRVESCELNLKPYILDEVFTNYLYSYFGPIMGESSWFLYAIPLLSAT